MRLVSPRATAFFIVFSLVCLALFSPPSEAKAVSTLKLPVQSELLVLDGQPATDLDLAKGQPITLSNKRHQVVFHLKGSIGSANNRENVQSRPFIISFHALNGHKYIIEVPRLMNTRQIEAINRNPGSKITLTNEKQEEVPFEIAVLPSRGVQIGRNYAADVRRFNLTDNEAALSEFAGMAVVDVPSGFENAQQDPSIYTNAEDNTVEENAMAERMLKYWFKEADKSTRARFLNWAQNQ